MKYFKLMHLFKLIQIYLNDFSEKLLKNAMTNNIK
jgi:hypothetical protein